MADLGRGSGGDGAAVLAMDWDASLPGEQAAEKAGVPITWLGIARMPVEPT